MIWVVDNAASAAKARNTHRLIRIVQREAALLNQSVRILDAHKLRRVPSVEGVKAVVIGGSYSSVLTKDRPFNINQQIVKKALQAGIPLLGICYGMQVLAVTCGGTAGKHEAGFRRQFIHIRGTSCGVRSSVLDSTRNYRVYASHSECIQKVPRTFRVLAVDAYKAPMVIQRRKHPLVVGLQYHPESSPAGSDAGPALIARFIRSSIRD